MAWTDHVALRLEVASLGGTGGGSLSRWTAASDAYKHRWTPASSDATGEPGRWELTLNIRDQNWTNWSTIPWVNVVCDAMTVHTAQGWSPYAWNASPNSASFTLIDPQLDFSPAGPDGRRLAIGFDLPVRVVADWLDPHGGEVTVWAGLIREVVWSATPGGERRATIRATEVTEVYGRTEPTAEGAQHRAKEPLTQRLAAIHALSDMPNLFGPPGAQSPKGPGNWNEGTATEWSPPTNWGTLYSWGDLASPSAHTAAATLDHNLWSDLTHWVNAYGNVSVALNYGHDPNINRSAWCGTPRLALVPPFPVRYQKDQFVEISDTCSDPAGYPFAHENTYPPSPRVRISPTALRITSSQADISNDVKVALAGTTGEQAHKINQASVDAYGRHTWGRNDIRLDWAGSSTERPLLAPQVAWRATLRSSMARDKLESLEFPVTCKRDLQALVGWLLDGEVTRQKYGMQPGKVAELKWSDPVIADAALLITKVEHTITPDEWTTKLGCEMFDMDHYYGKDNP